MRRRIRRRVSGGNGRLDWWVASLPATRGIECGTGEPSSVYMAERRAPGRGFEPPRLSHLAVFKTAAFPLCQPGAGGADCRRWTGLSGMRVQRAGVQRVSVIRRLRRQDGGGGGRSGIPNGMPQGTPMNALAYRRPIGRRHSGAANRRRPGMGGRFLGTPMGVLCEPPGTVPSIDGTVCGAGYCRHGMVPPGTVPPMGGTVSPGDGKARDGRARRGLAGMLGRSLEPPAFWLAGIPAARAAWNCRLNPGICARLRAGGKLGRGSSAFLSGPRVFIYGPRAFLQGPRGFPQERNAFLQGAGFLE